MDQLKIKKIKSIISCIETDNPNTDYSLITLLHDGPGKIKQVTLGNGLTEFSGDLKQCVRLYVSKNGKYSSELAHYVDKIGKYPSLSDDDTFINLLKKSSKEDQLMRDAQDEIFDKLDWIPAINWANDNKFIPTPLSLLVIYDSYVQSGQIFSFIRNKFKENTPKNGGDEKKWISAYSAARLNWLTNHSNEAVRESAYRMKTYIKLINANNWNLDGKIVTGNGCEVPA